MKMYMIWKQNFCAIFFLNQIKQNKRKATIRKLVVGEYEITEEKEIMNELKTFYSNLYSEKTTNIQQETEMQQQIQ